jgi:hypothetical protein
MGKEARYAPVAIQKRMYPRKTMMGGGGREDFLHLPKARVAVCISKSF